MARVNAGLQRGHQASSMDWPDVTAEERIRHEILFFSQGPIEGLLPGDQARELFLRSGLPLTTLSQVWKLADRPHDNMLDAWEFTASMVLLRGVLAGRRLPQVLPPSMCPPSSLAHTPQQELRIKLMTKRELHAYRKLFEVLDVDHVGRLSAACVKEAFVTSRLAASDLARIWNLSDVDRDGQLTCDEFCIGCHLVRNRKSGRSLDGLINVFSLLPHKMLKTDLAAKKAKMAELEATKRRLMALKDRRKKQASRESHRVALWRERLQILRMRHQALRTGCEDEDLVGEAQRHQARVEADVGRMEAVAHKLQKQHERVRQETAHVIIEEQKFSQEVEKLEEEALRMRERRKRNSIIKDVDPFHQLFEERKEERLTGITTPKKKHEVHIPFSRDPFDPDSLADTPLSGEELFGCEATKSPPFTSGGADPDPDGDVDTTSGGPHSADTPGEGGRGEGDPPSPWPTPTSKAGGGQGADPVGEDMMELTHGFEDNFVEVWTQSRLQKRDTNRNILKTSVLDKVSNEFVFSLEEEEEDPVFRTISVTEEEDDLWRSLPDSVLATHREQIHYMQLKWNNSGDALRQLAQQGQRVVFKNEEDYEAYKKSCSDDFDTRAALDPPRRSRRLSDSSVQDLDHGSGGGAAPSRSDSESDKSPLRERKASQGKKVPVQTSRSSDAIVPSYKNRRSLDNKEVNRDRILLTDSDSRELVSDFLFSTSIDLKKCKLGLSLRSRSSEGGGESGGSRDDEVGGVGQGDSNADSDTPEVVASLNQSHSGTNSTVSGLNDVIDDGNDVTDRKVEPKGRGPIKATAIPHQLSEDLVVLDQSGTVSAAISHNAPAKAAVKHSSSLDSGTTPNPDQTDIVVVETAPHTPNKDHVITPSPIVASSPEVAAVLRRKTPPGDRQARETKAQSWCVTSSPPVAPPRLKRGSLKRGSLKRGSSASDSTDSLNAASRVAPKPSESPAPRAPSASSTLLKLGLPPKPVVTGRRQAHPVSVEATSGELTPERCSSASPASSLDFSSLQRHLRQDSSCSSRSTTSSVPSTDNTPVTSPTPSPRRPPRRNSSRQSKAKTNGPLKPTAPSAPFWFTPHSAAEGDRLQHTPPPDHPTAPSRPPAPTFSPAPQSISSPEAASSSPSSGSSAVAPSPLADSIPKADNQKYSPSSQNPERDASGSDLQPCRTGISAPPAPDPEPAITVTTPVDVIPGSPERSRQKLSGLKSFTSSVESADESPGCNGGPAPPTVRRISTDASSVDVSDASGSGTASSAPQPPPRIKKKASVKKQKDKRPAESATNVLADRTKINDPCDLNNQESVYENISFASKDVKSTAGHKSTETPAKGAKEPLLVEHTSDPSPESRETEAETKSERTIKVENPLELSISEKAPEITVKHENSFDSSFYGDSFLEESGVLDLKIEEPVTSKSTTSDVIEQSERSDVTNSAASGDNLVALSSESQGGSDERDKQHPHGDDDVREVTPLCVLHQGTVARGVSQNGHDNHDDSDIINTKTSREQTHAKADESSAITSVNSVNKQQTKPDGDGIAASDVDKQIITPDICDSLGNGVSETNTDLCDNNTDVNPIIDTYSDVILSTSRDKVPDVIYGLQPNLFPIRGSPAKSPVSAVPTTLSPDSAIATTLPLQTPASPTKESKLVVDPTVDPVELGIPIGEKLLDDPDLDEDDDMDAYARKQELERLRAQFFGKHKGQPEAGAEPSGVHYSDGATVVTIGTDQDARLVQQQQHSATVMDVNKTDVDSASSLYEIVKQKKTTGSVNPGGPKATIPRDSYGGLIPASGPPETVQPKASRIILDLDEFSSPSTYERGGGGGGGGGGAGGRGDYGLGMSAEPLIPTAAVAPKQPKNGQSKIILDLDDLDQQSGLPPPPPQFARSPSPAAATGVSGSYPGRGPASHSAPVQDETAPASPPWDSHYSAAADDSDMSDHEGGFQATFTPGGLGGGHMQSPAAEHSDQGIVLVGYQSRSQGAGGTAATDAAATAPPPPTSPVPVDHNATMDVQYGGLAWHSASADKASSGSPPASGGVTTVTLTKPAGTGGAGGASGPIAPPTSLPQTYAAPPTQRAPHQHPTAAAAAAPATREADTSAPVTASSPRPPVTAPPATVSAVTAVTSDTSADDGSRRRQRTPQNPGLTRSQQSVVASEDPDEGITPPDLVSEMDPVTGLRRTGVSTPMEKALRFMESTEVSFKVRRKERSGEEANQDPISPDHIQLSRALEQERADIMEQTRVRARRMDSWLSTDGGGSPVADGIVSPFQSPSSPVPVASLPPKTDSERKYEERKRRLDQQRVTSPQQQQQQQQQQPDVVPAYRPDDVDASSIQHEQTKRHWEARFAEPNVKLFPDHQPIPTRTGSGSGSSDGGLHENGGNYRRF